MNRFGIRVLADNEEQIQACLLVLGELGVRVRRKEEGRGGRGTWDFFLESIAQREEIVTEFARRSPAGGQCMVSDDYDLE